jgi:hypothetical protein
MTAFTERRASRRFPLRLSLKYRPIGCPANSNWSLSESVNISSAGLLFTTSEAVAPGQAIEALIAWPAALDRHVKLSLAIKGRVVRCAPEGTAMRFNTYEFRTCQRASEASRHHTQSDSWLTRATSPGR